MLVEYTLMAVNLDNLVETPHSQLHLPTFNIQKLTLTLKLLDWLTFTQLARCGPTLFSIWRLLLRQV